MKLWKKEKKKEKNVFDDKQNRKIKKRVKKLIQFGSGFDDLKTSIEVDIDNLVEDRSKDGSGERR